MQLSFLVPMQGKRMCDWVQNHRSFMMLQQLSVQGERLPYFMGEKLVQRVIATSWKPFRHEEQGEWDTITSQILST